MNARAAFICVLVCAASAPALAVEQSVDAEIARCVNARQDYTRQQQVVGCTAAIGSRKWSGRGLAWAYSNRGMAYFLEQDLDSALADFEQAIRLDPKSASAFNNRGLVQVYKGDFGRAVADLDETIRLDPENSGVYFNRGVALFHKGDLARAAADFDRAGAGAPQNAYIALWRDIADRRVGRPGKLAASAEAIDAKAWPAPIVRFYLGQLSREALFAVANEDAQARPVRVCEANLYAAELALRRNATDDALPLLLAAAQGCPQGPLARAQARAELAALGAKP